MVLRLANAIVVKGECDLSAFALPEKSYGIQHRFMVEWSDDFQVAGENGIRIVGHKCNIILQGNTVVKVIVDWK